MVISLIGNPDIDPQILQSLLWGPSKSTLILGTPYLKAQGAFELMLRKAFEGSKHAARRSKIDS